MTSLLDLPYEILAHILSYVFPPWSATMSITCELSPISNIRILRTNKFFFAEGLKALQRSFTGEFIRYDRRGRIIDKHLYPTKWYTWIMQNTSLLHLNALYFTLWYIPSYWVHYPALKGFCLSVLEERAYNDPVTEMPDYEQRRRRCDELTDNFAHADYCLHPYLLDEPLITIYRDMDKHCRKEWPTVEFRFHDCKCHPMRRTIYKLIHIETPVDVGVPGDGSSSDESFEAFAYHAYPTHTALLHRAILSCTSLPNSFGWGRRLALLPAYTQILDTD